MIAQMKGVTGLTSIRNPRINKTIDEINSRSGVIAAVMQARNSQISVAQNLIDRSVNAINADRNDRINYYNSLLGFYGEGKNVELNKIINLDDEKKVYIASQIAMIENEVASSQVTANYIKEMMANPESAAMAAAAGLTLNDSVETLNKKLSIYTVQKNFNDEINRLTEEGYTYIPKPLATMDKNQVTIFTFDGIDQEGNIVTKTAYFKNPTDVAAGLATNYGLTALDQVKATNLAVKMYGQRSISKPELIKPIMEMMSEGKSVDDIEDIIRYSSESVLFQGVIRNAAESIGSDMTTAKRENLFNTIDRSLEEDNMDRVKQILKKSAIESYDVSTSKLILGTERTIEFLDEIEQDLINYEKAGGDTNIFTGTWEKVAAKAGMVSAPDLRRIATKIATAVQKYRRAMSGVAFSVPESEEYKKMFPDIDKTSSFNTATIAGLKEVMVGDVEFYLGERMGYNTYREIYGEGGGIIGEITQTKETTSKNIWSDPALWN